MRVRPVDLEDGSVALGLLLRQLDNTGVFMQATAHPDDENNALHVYSESRARACARFSRPRHAATAARTRSVPSSSIRSRCCEPKSSRPCTASMRPSSTSPAPIDFGYSFSIEETLEKWGRDEIIGDYVRLIRMTRPDVVLGMIPTGTAGGLHHQTSGLLSREAFKAAGDPSRYPEQIRDGLMPWQPRKYYYPAGRPGLAAGAANRRRRRQAPLPARRVESGDVRYVGVRSRCSGRTYAEIGTEERGMHKSQAMASSWRCRRAGRSSDSS